MLNTPNEKKNVIVIGHKNPDTDSICSAICYANLMNAIRERDLAEGRENNSPVYEPCRAGVISPETSYVLDHFQFPIPRICVDVKAQVSDLDIRKVSGIASDVSLRDAWLMMNEKELHTLPVVDEANHLEGLISVNDIALATMESLDSAVLASSNVPVRNILKTIDAELMNGDPDHIITKGRLTIGASSPESVEINYQKDDIVIVGNRKEMMLCAIELGASVVIVCMADSLSEEIQQKARENNCILIRTSHDTYSTACKLNQSIPVSNYMKTDLMTFEPSDKIENVKDIMSRTRIDYFPVVDQGKLIGLISKRNLISLQKKELVLVDHNEKSQCVDGFEEAEILAIIDHHRIGDIETTGPVIFRNVPVGCTATIITDMYRENDIEITPSIAGLLLSAILSDTLCFKSPTCTRKDEITGKALAAIAGVDYNQLASDMFDAGEDLTGKTPESIFKNDYKILRSGGKRIAIAQGTFNSPNNLKKAESIMNDYIGEVLGSEKVDLAFYIATSISTQSSDVIHAGKDSEAALLKAFRNSIVNDGSEGALGVHVPGLVSRKKQFVPSIINALAE